MSVGTIIAIGVAAASVAATWILGIRRLGTERELVDLEAVRQVLDDAAVALHRVTFLLDEAAAEAGFSWLGNDPDDLKRLRGDLESRHSELTETVERLRIRFGTTHGIVETYEGAADAVFGEIVGLRRLEVYTRRPDGIPMEKTKGAEKHFEDTRADFEAQRAEFAVAAHRTAGARLPT